MRSKFRWLQVRSSAVDLEVYRHAAELDDATSMSQWIRESLAKSAAEAAERLETEAAS